ASEHPSVRTVVLPFITPSLIRHFGQRPSGVFAGSGAAQRPQTCSFACAMSIHLFLLQTENLRPVTRSAQSLEKITKFRFDLLGGRDRPRDLFPQQLAVALSQSMRGDFSRAATDSQLPAEFIRVKI